ncbi:hypothetical protein DPM19_24220 [Actinomadura craniellae]|uniref:Uncharacterized protein n=1 Tax=Actinomadura craniellae TaxID=2231787 RepID=A0A365H0T9_9ACTN|nr:nucleotide disphospho-sugar-binding domain-containing protein [Actinomadura craniellae]RAY12700.1 hypothetical protein DPM19_24220 [Actinomadura craniellae]
MRVLFTVSSWPTQYSAMVPLGWALQAAGHEVRVLCAASQVGPVSQAGLLPVPVLDGMEEVMRLRLQYYWEAVTGIWPYTWLPPHPLTGEPMDDLADFDPAGFDADVAPALAERADRSFDAAVEFARGWRPQLVLHDPGSLEGLLAARATGVPAALCLWGPASVHDPEHMRIVPTDHSGAFPRHGLGEFALDMIENVVDPNPPSLDVPVHATRLPVRYVPYNGSKPVPAWTLEPARRRRVCVTWSTALSTVSGPGSYLLPAILQGLGDLDCEVVVTATAHDVAALGDVPANARAVEHVPLATFLPGCAAVVHHGGSGSSLTSLWSAVPQLIATFAAEQAVTGRRVAASGVGLHLPGDQADPERIRAGVRALLDDDSYQAAAGKLREEIMAAPTPAELVGTLERLAAG